jgi:curved DNA-binding protein
MTNNPPADLYEELQVSPNADPDTIHRVYRLLAQRWHPDNQRTGDVARFRTLHEAYLVLGRPEKRAAYDLAYHAQRNTRWHVASTEPEASNDVEVEQIVRLTVLEVLYARRRTQPGKPGVFPGDLEELTGQPREHLEFTAWYLTQKRFVVRTDNSHLAITAEGVDYLESHAEAHTKRRLLDTSSVAVDDTVLSAQPAAFGHR